MKLRALFASVDEGLCLLEVVRGPDGSIVDLVVRDANRAFERQTALSRTAGRSVRDLLPAFDAPWIAICSRVLVTGEPFRTENYLRDVDRWSSVFFLRLGGPDSRYVAVVFNDVTERRRAEASLRESEARQAFLLRLTDAIAPLGDANAIQHEASRVLGEQIRVDRAYYWEIDEVQDEILVARDYVRGAVPSLAGRYPMAAFSWVKAVFETGRRLVVTDVATAPLIPDASRDAVAALQIAAFTSIPLIKDGRLVAALSVTDAAPRVWTLAEIDLVAETAERTWGAVERARAEAGLRRARDELEARVHARTSELGRTNAALETEVRERRAAEAQIKALFKRLVSVQEQERRRIARDIHDQVGQQVTALRMHLDALRDRLGADAAALDQAERTRKLAEELDQSIDFLTWQLRPTVLDDLGLAAALDHLVSGWSQRSGVAAEFDGAGAEDLRLAPDVETNLYRVAQEALHNVVKHAGATRVTVRLASGDGRATLSIEDDGRGFAVASPGGRATGAAGGLGLVGMRERATLVGGAFTIETAPGRGTAIMIRVPLVA